LSFTFKQFEIGPMQNFCYLIGDDKTKEAFVVDPAWSPQKIVETVEKEGFKLKGFLVSHAHYDHTNAIEELLKKFDVPVYANRAEIEYAKSGNAIVGSLGKTARPLDGGDKVQLGDTEIEFLHTPGHTPGSQCMKIGHHLVTGDTLFVGGCGRSDLPGGDPAMLFKSLKKIAGLPGSIEICPGHDYGEVPRRKLQEEMKENPYLKIRDVDQFLQTI
jgi:glyoxylase-like metal-dependent hydrolase (beta-lactamase superfamily II)